MPQRRHIAHDLLLQLERSGPQRARNQKGQSKEQVDPRQNIDFFRRVKTINRLSARREAMPALLPLFCFFASLFVARKFRGSGWRETLLLGALFWGVAVTVITESLSRFRWLDFRPIFCAWSFLLLILLLVAGFGRRGGPFAGWNGVSRFEAWLLAGAALIVLAVGLTALISPPNSRDAMTYHLGRVMHWMQNKSVAFYPTHILRQLHLAPWSDFAILQFQLLAGNDRLANCVDWFSMTGCLAGVSLLARELGAARRGQVFAAVLCATLPVGILQGSGALSDYVVSFWLACFVVFTLLYAKRGGSFYALACGAALGLALLTKATAYLYAAPFVAWLGFSALKSRKFSHPILIAAVACCMNLGHYARNYELCGKILGPGREQPASYIYANDLFTPSSLASNILRNVSLQLETRSSRVNDALRGAVVRLHRMIGISPSDPRTTWTGEKYYVPELISDEGYSANPLHFLLLLTAIFACRRGNRLELIYIGSLLLGFLLFCGYLRWQPWHNRLLLPLFVLAAPFIGLELSRTRHAAAANACMAALIVLAAPWVLRNRTRPMIGKGSIFLTSRMDQYFAVEPPLDKPYTEAAGVLARFPNVGLLLGQDNLEYPLWVLLRRAEPGSFHLEHVNVTNISNREYRGKPEVDAIFAVYAGPPPRSVTVGNIAYSIKWSREPVSVYIREPAQPSP